MHLVTNLDRSDEIDHICSAHLIQHQRFSGGTISSALPEEEEEMCRLFMCLKLFQLNRTFLGVLMNLPQLY